MEAVVTDIQSFSLHDGPGIRTTVFFKGCNLRCFWCHNPETLSSGHEIQFFRARCAQCGACVSVCPFGAQARGENIAFLREKCHACGACAAACPVQALRMAGRTMDVRDIAARVEQDKAFFDKSGGGMTLSGGEPLLQVDAAAALLQGVQERGIHTALETAGHVPFSAFERILPHTDLVLLDIKSVDKAHHKRGTGVTNERIRDNARALSERGAALWLRTPVVSGYNDTVEAIRAIGEWMASLPQMARVELLPFHRMGAPKYASLDMPYEAAQLQAPDKAHMEELRDVWRAIGLPVA